MGIRDWDIVTSYVDSVTTTLKTVTFPKVQESVKVKNQGNTNLTYSIGTKSGTLTPGQSVIVTESISSFTIQAASGIQPFELIAKEKGTEQAEIETDFSTALAERLRLGHTDHNGATDQNPMIEIGVIGAGAAFHILTGETMTAPYAIGLGVDHDGKTGMTVSIKANNDVGIGIDLTSTSGANSVGLFAQAIGAGTPVKLVQGSGSHGSLVDLRNDYGGTGNMLSWSSANQGYFGKIGQDGSIVRTLGTTGSDHQLISTVGSTHSESHYHYSGTPGLWFYTGMVSYSNRFIVQQANPAAIGAETPLKLIECVGGNQIGFYGATPVNKPTGVAITAAGIHAALVSLGLISA